jgi:hypothetical protein
MSSPIPLAFALGCFHQLNLLFDFCELPTYASHCNSCLASTYTILSSQRLRWSGNRFRYGIRQNFFGDQIQ